MSESGPSDPRWEGEPHPLTRWSVIAAVALLVVVVIGLFVLWPTGELPVGDQFFVSDVYAAEVTSVREGPCRNVAELECTQVRFVITTGPRAGDVFRQDFFGDITDPNLEVGDAAVVNFLAEAEPDFQYQYADRQRRPTLWWLAGVFALAVVALGRWRGVRALISLGSSFLILLAFALPALLLGADPLMVALIGSGAVAYLTLYLGHGFTVKTTVALLGSLASLIVVGVLASVAVGAASLTGLATEEAIFLPILSEAIDFRGLVLAGIVLGTMGALDDVTVTQAEAIWELHEANPDLTSRELVGAGLRIGRAHIASTVNTLALAYAGAALPLLLLFLVADQSLGTVANSEIVATEIIRTLAGSVGLVASVPLTTWLAASIVGSDGG